MERPDFKHWTVRGDLMVSFFGAGPIAADVWQDYCDTIASSTVRLVLSTSIGVVEVDGDQRKQVHAAARREPAIRAAVVTDEPLVRGLMVAIAWLGRVESKAFRWHQLEDAYHYLEPRGPSLGEALDLVDEVRRRVEAR